jgi:predicted nucleic acid-binding protein
MNTAAGGRMLVVDAGCLFEVVAATPQAGAIREHLGADPDWAAPHVVDVEVYSVIRRQHRGGGLDGTAAAQAVRDLSEWPGERFGHRLLLERAWELRDSVRGWDAMYVALAEALAAPLLTTDERLTRAPGPRCEFECFAASSRP